MSEILTQRLVGKSIVGIDGTVLGTLSNVTIDLESGALRELVVEPDEQSPPSIAARSGDDGRMRVPIDRIESVSDRIVVRYSG